MTTDTVLKDDEIDRLRRQTPETVWGYDVNGFGRAIEQAVLQSAEVQKLRDALRWQPIETAPKDFVTEFDGWNGERIPNVLWAHPDYEAKGEYAWCRAVYEHHHGWVMERVQGLTHWMPLPAPPQQ